MNEFPIVYCFGDSEEKRKELMEKLGVDSLDEVVATGYGGYLTKENEKIFIELVKRHMQEIMDNYDDLDFVVDMFVYELENHEYGYTGDIEDTLDALNLTLDEINANQTLVMGLKIALDKINGREEVKGTMEEKKLERSKADVNKISDIMSKLGVDIEAICTLLLKEHRTVQAMFTRLAISWIEKVASDDYRYDDRNETEHFMAKNLIETGFKNKESVK